MSHHSAMLHVRVDEQLKTEATQALAGVGLTLSDAVRILLTRIVSEGGSRPGWRAIRLPTMPGSAPRSGKPWTTPARPSPTRRPCRRPRR